MNFTLNDAWVETRSVELFTADRPLHLESGIDIGPVIVAYETYGHLNQEGDNAILVCHALTGSAHAGGFSGPDPASAGWWEPMIGSGRALDTDTSFVICSNFLGGCYGTTGPTSLDPRTGRRYGARFPAITVRDMVRVQKRLLETLGVRRLRTVLGGSLGGMQVLEWAVMYPESVASIVPIATASAHSAWCIGLNEIGRQAIMLDPGWMGGEYPPDEQPAQGLSLARQVAMVSYRSDISFQRRFGRGLADPVRRLPNSISERPPFFEVERYLHYQGEKLVRRFDANTYITITRAMDAHDLGPGRGSCKDALALIQCPALCVGISSDILYPPHEQQEIADGIPGGRYREIVSPNGHDAFLIEYEQLTSFVREFLQEVCPA